MFLEVSFGDLFHDSFNCVSVCNLECVQQFSCFLRCPRVFEHRHRNTWTVTACVARLRVTMLSHLLLLQLINQSPTMHGLTPAALSFFIIGLCARHLHCHLTLLPAAS